MDGSVPGEGLATAVGRSCPRGLPGKRRELRRAATVEGGLAGTAGFGGGQRLATRCGLARKEEGRKKYLNFTLPPLVFSPCTPLARPKCTSRARESGQAGWPGSEQVAEPQSGGPQGRREIGQHVHFRARWRGGCGMRPNEGWPGVLVTLTTAIRIKKK